MTSHCQTVSALAKLPHTIMRDVLKLCKAPRHITSISDLLDHTDTDKIVKPQRPEPGDFAGTMATRITQYVNATAAYKHECASVDRARREAQALAEPLKNLQKIAADIGLGIGVDVVTASMLLDADANALATTADALARAARERAAADLPADYEEFNPAWQRRRLRKIVKCTRVQIDAVCRRVGAHRTYASDETTAAWQSQQDRANTWASKQRVKSSDGDTLKLSDVITAAESNRVKQLYAMIKALENVMDSRGMLPIFLTLTLPPKYHPNPSKGRRSFDPACGPVAGHAALQQIWANTRRRLTHKRVKFYGIRVIEGHKDGCPHMHILLWIESGDLATLEETIDKYDEMLKAGKKQRQHKIQLIDDMNCCASSYVFKYIAKSLNSLENVNVGEVAGEGPRHIENFSQSRAWAAAIGVRRWALVGIAPGTFTAWRMLFSFSRKKKGGAWVYEEVENLTQDSTLMSCINLMRASAYAELLKKMGAVKTHRSNDKITLMTETTSAPDSALRKRYVGIYDESGEFLIKKSGQSSRLIQPKITRKLRVPAAVKTKKVRKINRRLVIQSLPRAMQLTPHRTVLLTQPTPAQLTLRGINTRQSRRKSKSQRSMRKITARRMRNILQIG